jgi:hypothetical protein
MKNKVSRSLSIPLGNGKTICLYTGQYQEK